MKGVAEALLKHVAHPPLGVCNADVERQIGQPSVLGAKFTAQQVIPHLGAVSVGDDETSPGRGERDQVTGGLGRSIEVAVDRVVSAGPLHCVAPKRDDRQRRFDPGTSHSPMLRR